MQCALTRMSLDALFFFLEREIWIGKKRIEYTQLEKTSSVLIRFMIHPASVKLEGTRGSARNLLFRSMLELRVRNIWPASNTTDEGSDGAVGGALEVAIVVACEPSE